MEVRCTWCGCHGWAISDIRGFTYAFAKWRLRPHGVKFIDITPGESPPLGGPYATILLMTVLEHLPNPTEVVGMLLDSLEPGGHLIFDYILGSGTGLDTREAIHERRAVLDLITSRCDIVHGAVRHDQSMGTTVARRRQGGV